MRILQTLGQYQGNQEGIFGYTRRIDGVRIDSSVGHATLNPGVITLTNVEWNAILQEIAGQTTETFRITGTAPFTEPPRVSLYELLSNAVPNPIGGWLWNDSWKSYVCAILEHEGTIHLYHGTLGPHASAIICLKRD